MALDGTEPELNRECSVLVYIHLSLLFAIVSWMAFIYNVMNICSVMVFYFNCLFEGKDI